MYVPKVDLWLFFLCRCRTSTGKLGLYDLETKRISWEWKPTSDQAILGIDIFQEKLVRFGWDTVYIEEVSVCYQYFCNSYCRKYVVEVWDICEQKLTNSVELEPSGFCKISILSRSGRLIRSWQVMYTTTCISSYRTQMN